MKASELFKILKDAGIGDDDAKAQVKDAIVKGEAADDMNLCKATASKVLADLIAKGMPEAAAKARVEAMAKGGLVTDDAATVEGDDLIAKAKAAGDELRKAAEALAAASDAPPPATEPDPDATEGQLFKGAAERAAEMADTILKAQGDGYQALVKAQLAQAAGYEALVKSNVKTQAALAGVSDKLDLVFKALNVELPPRARTGAEAEPHPGERRTDVDPAGRIAKGAKLEALLDALVKANPARAREAWQLRADLENGGDPDLLAVQAGLSL